MRSFVFALLAVSVLACGSSDDSVAPTPSGTGGSGGAAGAGGGAGAAGTSASAGMAGQGGDAGATAGGAAGTGAAAGAGGQGGSGPTMATWTPFASRGDDSRWGVPLAYSTKSKTFLGFSGSKYPSPTATGMFSLSMTTGAWTPVTDQNEPTPTYCSCVVYLPDQDQVLAFAGLSTSGPLPAASLVFDVASGAWTKLAGTGPKGGIGCTATWMPKLGRAIVFGGLSTAGFSAETWSYDPVAQTFEKLAPATSPPARADGLAVYDEGDGGRILLFAGTQNETSNTKHRNDLWAFDGTTWTELMPTGPLPPERRVPAGGFDPVRRRWVIFGGTVETMDYGDLWVLDVAANSWTQQMVDGAPTPRGFASSGYDPDTDAYFVIGGLAQPSGVTVKDGFKLVLPLASGQEAQGNPMAGSVGAG